jgi:hypothetical protein
MVMGIVEIFLIGMIVFAAIVIVADDGNFERKKKD